MFEHVVRKGGLKESEARWFFQQLLVGVDYVHRMVSAPCKAGLIIGLIHGVSDMAHMTHLTHLADTACGTCQLACARWSVSLPHAATAASLQGSSKFPCLCAGSGKPRYQARKHSAGWQSQAVAEDLRLWLLKGAPSALLISCAAIHVVPCCLVPLIQQSAVIYNSRAVFNAD